MGRPFGISKVEWRVRISKDLAGRLEHLLSDPRYNRVTYGIRSAMIEKLLRDWVNSVERKQIKLPSIEELESHDRPQTGDPEGPDPYGLGDSGKTEGNVSGRESGNTEENNEGSGT